MLSKPFDSILTVLKDYARQKEVDQRETRFFVVFWLHLDEKHFWVTQYVSTEVARHVYGFAFCVVWLGDNDIHCTR